MEISFVIITNGSRNNVLLQSIETIRQFDCDKEIVVVGFVGDLILPSDVNFIYFDEQPEKGWITRKKNIGCALTKYDIIVVLHDDIVLDKDFADGLIKINEPFDAAGIKYLQNGRVFDWAYRGPSGHHAFCYDMTDKNCYIDGTAIILKRKTWESQKWDESLFINQEEDVEYSRRLIDNGFIVRAFGQLKGRTINQGTASPPRTHRKGCMCEN